MNTIIPAILPFTCKKEVFLLVGVDGGEWVRINSISLPGVFENFQISNAKAEIYLKLTHSLSSLALFHLIYLNRKKLTD